MHPSAPHLSTFLQHFPHIDLKQHKSSYILFFLWMGKMWEFGIHCATNKIYPPQYKLVVNMCFTQSVKVHRFLNIVHQWNSPWSALIVDPRDVHQLSLIRMSINPPHTINTLSIYSLRQLSIDPLPTSTVCVDLLWINCQPHPPPKSTQWILSELTGIHLPSALHQ